MILNLPLRTQQKRSVSAEQVETLFSEGWTMQEVAARMNLRYTYLAGRINESLSLTEAKQRGLAKYAAIQLNKQRAN
jgi:AraC-like DNA-binding protein